MSDDNDFAGRRVAAERNADAATRNIWRTNNPEPWKVVACVAAVLIVLWLLSDAAGSMRFGGRWVAKSGAEMVLRPKLLSRSVGAMQTAGGRTSEWKFVRRGPHLTWTDGVEVQMAFLVDGGALVVFDGDRSTVFAREK